MGRRQRRRGGAERDLVDDVGNRTGEDVSGLGDIGVDARAAFDRVVACTTKGQVVAAAAEDGVRAVSARDEVAVVATVDGVVPARRF